MQPTTRSGYGKQISPDNYSGNSSQKYTTAKAQEQRATTSTAAWEQLKQIASIISTDNNQKPTQKKMAELFVAYAEKQMKPSKKEEKLKLHEQLNVLDKDVISILTKLKTTNDELKEMLRTLHHEDLEKYKKQFIKSCKDSKKEQLAFLEKKNHLHEELNKRIEHLEKKIEKNKNIDTKEIDYETISNQLEPLQVSSEFLLSISNDTKVKHAKRVDELTKLVKIRKDIESSSRKMIELEVANEILGEVVPSMISLNQQLAELKSSNAKIKESSSHIPFAEQIMKRMIEKKEIASKHVEEALMKFKVKHRDSPVLASSKSLVEDEDFELLEKTPEEITPVKTEDFLSLNISKNWTQLLLEFDFLVKQFNILKMEAKILPLLKIYQKELSQFSVRMREVSKGNPSKSEHQSNYEKTKNDFDKICDDIHQQENNFSQIFIESDKFLHSSMQTDSITSKNELENLRSPFFQESLEKAYEVHLYRCWANINSVRSSIENLWELCKQTAETLIGELDLRNFILLKAAEAKDVTSSDFTKMYPVGSPNRAVVSKIEHSIGKKSLSNPFVRLDVKNTPVDTSTQTSQVASKSGKNETNV